MTILYLNCNKRDLSGLERSFSNRQRRGPDMEQWRARSLPTCKQVPRAELAYKAAYLIHPCRERLVVPSQAAGCNGHLHIVVVLVVVVSSNVHFFPLTASTSPRGRP